MYFPKEKINLQDEIDWMFIEMMCSNPSIEEAKRVIAQLKEMKNGNAKTD